MWNSDRACCEAEEYLLILLYKNIVRIEDNGVGTSDSLSNVSSKGRGTKQALSLAKQLGGKFKRYSKFPPGTICELS